MTSSEHSRARDAFSELDAILARPARSRRWVAQPSVEARARLESALAFVASQPEGDRPEVVITRQSSPPRVMGYRDQQSSSTGSGSLRVRFRARPGPKPLAQLGVAVFLLAAVGVAPVLGLWSLVPAAVLLCAAVAYADVRSWHELTIRDSEVVLRTRWHDDRVLSTWLAWRNIPYPRGGGHDVGLFDTHKGGDALLLVSPREQGISVLPELSAAYIESQRTSRQ